MSQSIKGPWSEIQIDEFLRESVFPLRLATTGADGFPRVVAVWFYYQQGKFFCVSHRDSQLVALLRANSKVGFEVSPNQPPYCGVRGQGIVTMLEDGAGDVLEQLLQRYLGAADSSLGKWLLSRKDDELIVCIEPQRIFTWDYRKRMNND